MILLATVLVVFPVRVSINFLPGQNNRKYKFHKKNRPVWDGFFCLTTFSNSVPGRRPRLLVPAADVDIYRSHEFIDVVFLITFSN